MRLAILGGGGFRVPLVYGALLRDTSERRVDEVVLYDVDEGRLAAVGHVLRQMAAGREQAPRVATSTDLDTAVTGADFVFSAIRVGGLAGRTADERVALDLGRARARRPPVRAAWPTGCGPCRSPSTSPNASRRSPRRRLGHQLHQPGRDDHRGDAAACSAAA